MLETRKVAHITGCSESGSLGVAFAWQYLDRGYRVFARARRTETLGRLEQEGWDILALDITDDSSVMSAVTEVEKRTDRLDVRINNAGVSSLGPLLDTDVDRFRATHEINLVAPLRMIQAFSYLLFSTANGPAAGTGTVVINVGSSAGNGVPWEGPYDPSKAALRAMSYMLRYEMQNLEVHVVALNLEFYPNWSDILAALSRTYADLTAKSPSANAVAKLVVDATDGKKSVPATVHAGASSTLMGKLYGFVPQWLLDMLFRQVSGLDMVQQPEAD